VPRISKHMPRDESGSVRKSRLAQRIKLLRRKRATVDQELRRLEKLWASLRPWYTCKRCGHEWQGVNLDGLPRNCARCHSAGWNSLPKVITRARKPTDEPNPKWEGRKGGTKRGAPIVMVPVPPVPFAEPMSAVESIDLGIDPSYLASLPAGLPPPPSFIPKAASVIEMERDSARVLNGYFPLPPPPSLQAPEPIMYRPRSPADAPQPESMALPMAIPEPEPEPPAPEPEPEPDWDNILPKIALTFDRDAVQGEEAWLDAD
jgi:hypothetical protein